MKTNHLAENSAPNCEKDGAKSLETSLLDEFPALPEKFFTFTHEGISELWMQESIEQPIRGMSSGQS